MLTKLSERWQQTGLWEQITTKKVIVTEPRFTDEFESAMRHFYEVIKFLGYDYFFRLYKDLEDLTDVKYKYVMSNL